MPSTRVRRRARGRRQGPRPHAPLAVSRAGPRTWTAVECPMIGLILLPGWPLPPRSRAPIGQPSPSHAPSPSAAAGAFADSIPPPRARPPPFLYPGKEKKHTPARHVVACHARADRDFPRDGRDENGSSRKQRMHICNQSSQKRVTLRYVLLTYVEAWNDRSMQKHCMFASHAADCSFVAARAYVVRGWWWSTSAAPTADRS